MLSRPPESRATAFLFMSCRKLEEWDVMNILIGGGRVKMAFLLTPFPGPL
jgi:hypothetical protein